MQLCPECNNALYPGATVCGCGWGQKTTKLRLHAVSGDPSPVLGYIQCDWVAGNNVRCRYPGTLSRSTQGTGPWYCRGHYGCDDPVAGADIVEASADYRHMSRSEASAIALEQASKRCAELGLHTIEQKREYWRKTAGLIGRK